MPRQRRLGFSSAERRVAAAASQRAAVEVALVIIWGLSLLIRVYRACAAAGRPTLCTFSTRQEKQIRSVSNTLCRLHSLTPGLRFSHLFVVFSLFCVFASCMLSFSIFTSDFSGSYDLLFLTFQSWSLTGFCFFTVLLTCFYWNKYNINNAARASKHTFSPTFVGTMFMTAVITSHWFN